MRDHLLSILQRVTGDEQVGRVFEIATRKIEHVEAMLAVRERHLRGRGKHLLQLERSLKLAQRRGELGPSPPARQMAIGLQALLDGLIQNWLLDRRAFDLQIVGRHTLDVYLAGLAQGVPAAAS